MTDHNKGCPDCAAMGRNFQSFATSVALEILVQSAFHGGQIYHDIPDEIECDPRDNTALREAIFYNVRTAVLNEVNKGDTLNPDWEAAHGAGYEALATTFEFYGAVCDGGEESTEEGD